MRGGKSLADRGVIPRLLSNIYRRARKLEKDSEGATQVEVSMSYYEIYNDRVYDLFEPLEKRTPAGLPIRDAGNGKTQVVGLTERPCTTLKEFEQLYDSANVNRSTSATKLNAHSSRSHAILCVRVTQTTAGETRVSTASAIDLAGSEDNRRTDNVKERMVESASINKSLFVLAQCVEAISKKQARIPYRESKMTRILSLGQSNGFTVMILNLAPVRSYHLDTLSSLNFANRTKKIEVNEVENQPFFRTAPGKLKAEGAISNSLNAPSMNRQPLRPKLLSQNGHLNEVKGNAPKPAKQFSVYSDRVAPAQRLSHLPNTSQARISAPLKSPKRTSSEAIPSLGRPTKVFRAAGPSTAAKAAEPGLSKDAIEALIERKVNEALAERTDSTTVSNPEPIPDEVQRRLDALEKRVEGKETERAEGLQFLLMAKQHQLRGEDASALKMYQLAISHFPQNQRLLHKITALQDKIASEKARRPQSKSSDVPTMARPEPVKVEREPFDKHASRRKARQPEEDHSYDELQADDLADEDDYEIVQHPRTKIRRPQSTKPHGSAVLNSDTKSHGLHGSFELDREPALKHSPMAEHDSECEDLPGSGLSTGQTPRTKHLLTIINTKDVSQIKLLKGVGAKKAEAIVNCLCDMDDGEVTTLGQLGKLKGVGVKTVENMRTGVFSII